MSKPQLLDQVQWPEVVLAASASGEPFEDVTVVTAKSVFLDLALQAAAHICVEEGHSLSQDKVMIVARSLIAANKIVVQEHVRVNADGITVCLNVEDVDGEDVPWTALDYVARTLDSLDGAHGVVLFSNDLHFTEDQATSLRVI